MRILSLTCKNCGGIISFNAQTNTIICESCGSSQALNSALNPSDVVYESDSQAGAKVNSYHRALNMMSNATTIDSLKTAQLMFERISGTLNADALAKECKDRIELMITEKKYQQAILDMNSEEPDTVISAKNVFEILGSYKDSSQKSEECNELIEKAKITKNTNEIKQRKQAAKKRRMVCLCCIFLIIIIAVVLFARGYIYSSNRYDIDIQPTKQNYFTQTGNNFEFLYDVEIENNGFLDVAFIECDVIFENGNDVIADTKITYSNYTSVAVRSGKSNKFSWKLSTDSANVAEELYYNFDELDIRVEVTQIQFKNGKTKVY